MSGFTRSIGMQIGILSMILLTCVLAYVFIWMDDRQRCTVDSTGLWQHVVIGAANNLPG